VTKPASFVRRVSAIVVKEPTTLNGVELDPGDFIVFGDGGPEPWRFADFLASHGTSGPTSSAMLEEAHKLTNARPRQRL
jgi:hypothetical protein